MTRKEVLVAAFAVAAWLALWMMGAGMQFAGKESRIFGGTVELTRTVQLITNTDRDGDLYP
ncbi:MAG: hypothetical protein JOY54_18800 [Acidobacteriaceae bacterium]|nr:hypothetical protein [Acidobacteriaceae bacterium]